MAFLSSFFSIAAKTASNITSHYIISSHLSLYNKFLSYITSFVRIRSNYLNLKKAPGDNEIIVSGSFSKESVMISCLIAPFCNLRNQFKRQLPVIWKLNRAFTRLIWFELFLKIQDCLVARIKDCMLFKCCKVDYAMLQSHQALVDLSLSHLFLFS